MAVSVSYKIQVYEVQKTDEFDEWLLALTDQRAIAKIVSRIERLGMGNAGDAESVGEGISEMRIHHGAGYRVYYKRTGNTIMMILCGGDKSTQAQRHQASQRNRSAALKGRRWQKFQSLTPPTISKLLPRLRPI
jgi:putative addiction module killer protein